MTRNRFKIIFKTKDDKTFDVDYTLHDSVVAEKWFRQIKHLRRIPIDKVESDLVDLSDLHAIYQEFCEFAGLDPIILGKHLDQPQLNRLHQIYEDTHDDLSRRKDNSSLYKFHRAIHFYESRQIDPEYKGIGHIGWGVKGGPLEVVFNCNPYYESSLQQGNIYLPWSELGKTPLQYYNNGEPNTQSRFNHLAKPHITLRSKFFIAKKDMVPDRLDKQFITWFEEFKQGWLDHHRIEKWDEIDEKCAPLLAHTDQAQQVSDCDFVRIET